MLLFKYFPFQYHIVVNSATITANPPDQQTTPVKQHQSKRKPASQQAMRQMRQSNLAAQSMQSRQQNKMPTTQAYCPQDNAKRKQSTIQNSHIILLPIRSKHNHTGISSILQNHKTKALQRAAGFTKPARISNTISLNKGCLEHEQRMCSTTHTRLPGK